MIVYTPDQVFDLLGSVSCEADLIELEYYIIDNYTRYSVFDFILFITALNDLNKIFK